MINGNLVARSVVDYLHSFSAGKWLQPRALLCIFTKRTKGMIFREALHRVSLEKMMCELVRKTYCADLILFLSPSEVS